MRPGAPSPGRARIDRRLLLGGLAGLTAVRPASGRDALPVAHGVLAGNPIAQSFIPAPAELPDIRLDTPQGTVAIGEVLEARTVLMPVWAEWCMPCLIEIPDFARLQRAHGNGRFAILPVLSGARKPMHPADIAGLFEALRATVFMPMAEHAAADRLLQTMAAKGRGDVLPCNLLIAPSGKVVARQIGFADNGVDVAADPNDDFARAQKAADGLTQSLWGSPAGDQFAAAMAAGFAAG